MTKLEPAPNNQTLSSDEFQPHPDQLDRVRAARRFTRLYVYLPLAALTLIVAIVVLYLLYLALFPPTEGTYLYLSGLADFVLIIFMIPVAVVFGVLLFGGIGAYIYYKYYMDEADRPLPPAPQYGRIRTLLWRIDDLLIKIMPKVETAVGSISRPVIKLNGWLAYLGSWLKSIENFLLRRK